MTHDQILPASKPVSALYYDGQTRHHEREQYTVLNQSEYAPNGTLNLNGGVLTYTISPTNLLSTCFIRFSGFSALAANQEMQQGWIYNCVDQIRVQLGGSTLYQINGSANFFNLITDCENQEKRNSYLNLGGQANSTSGDIILALDLLWSRMRGGMHKKKPLPMYLLGQSLQITINLKNPIQGSAAQSWNPAFAEALMVCRTCVDKTHSLQLKINEGYHYPVELQNVIRQDIVGSSNEASPVNILLNSFQTGKLSKIKFMVVPTSNLYTRSVRLSNIVLKQAGNVIMKLDSYLAEAFQDSHSVCTANYITDNAARYIYTLNISDLEADYHSQETNSINLSNQFLNLSFNTSDSSNYIVYIIYCYNGSISFLNSTANFNYTH